MDELTIADKRYISAPRAAREHRYHSDYIGQLVRGGKVVGQKVGRSWYVEEESLLRYFNGETAAESRPLSVVVEEPAQETAVPQEVPREIVVEEAAVESASEPTFLIPTASEEPHSSEVTEEEIEPQETVHTVPLRIVEEKEARAQEQKNTGLVYLSDDLEEEALPQEALYESAPPAPAPATVSRTARRARAWPRALGLIFFAAVIFAVSTLVGAHLSATLTAAGQTAATGYLFQW